MTEEPSDAGHAPRSPEKRRVNQALLVGVGLAVMTVVAIVVLVMQGDDSATPEDAAGDTTTTEHGLIRDFSGTGNSTTPSFEVRRNWEARWQSDGTGEFRIELITADGRSRGNIVEATGEKDGSTFVVEEGTFRLKINAVGKWSVRIISQG